MENQLTYNKNGTELMKDILKAIVENDTFPMFDYINGRLKSRLFPEDTELWFWMGNIKLCIGDCTGQRAGDLLNVVGFEIDSNGEFVFHVDEEVSL